AAEAFAFYAKADDLGGAVDLVDRVGWYQPAAAGQETGADCKRVRLIRGGAVHRAFDPSYETASAVGHEEASGAAEVVGDDAHVSNVCPLCEFFRDVSIVAY